MKNTITRARLLAVSLLLLAVLALTFNQLTTISAASKTAHKAVDTCSEKVEDCPPAVVPTSSSIIFEAVTGHLLTTTF